MRSSAAEGPPPAVRPPADRVADRRRPEAGAGKVVVVDGPEAQARRASARRRRRRPSRRSRAGRATRSPRRPARSARATRSWSMLGDDPLLDGRDASPSSSRPTSESGAAATMLTAELEDPTRLRARRARRRGPGRARGRDQGRRRRQPSRSSRSARSTRDLRLRRRRAARGAVRARVRQRPGRAVPARRAAADARGRPRDRRARRGRLGPSRSASTTASTSRACALSRSERIHEAHMRAGVTIVDPRLDDDRRRRRDRRRHRDRALVRAAAARRRSASGATIGAVHHADRRRDRRRRDDPARPPRPAPASTRSATVGPFAYLRPDAVLARGRQGRHVRGDQELEHRARQQGAAPVLHRRRRRRRGHQPRRRQRSPPTTTARKKHRTTIGDRVRTSVDTDVRRAGDRRRRRLHGRRLGDHRRRPARSAGHRARAPDATSRATRSAFPGGSGDRADAVGATSYTPQQGERAGSPPRPEHLAGAGVQQAADGRLRPREPGARAPDRLQARASSSAP